ncbi:MAG: L,D-transpeptidase [Candidatus Saccharimonadales bacterium]|jgi:lipoprotein-anchoring transpeptidase ErfK/SrfK
MAGANAYAGKFVGNDFVLPQHKPKKIINPTVVVYRKSLPAFSPAFVETTAADKLQPSEAINNFLSSKLLHRLIIILLCLAIVAGGSVVAMQNHLLATVKYTAADIEHRIATKINPSSGFVLPPNSEVIESSVLSPEMNAIENQLININLSGVIVNPTPANVTSWLTTSAGPKIGTTVLTVKQPALMTYLNSVVQTYNHQPINQVTVAHPNEPDATIIKGVNGINYTIQPGLTHSLSSQILSANGASVTMSSSSIPFTVTNKPPFAKLLEVDTTTKRMYAWQDGQLINTFLVTAGAPATPTPLGQFKIFSKYLVQNMTGYNADGTRYYQPNVQWINYFYQSDAIHGNYWRPANVFGNINTSHGCVGVVNSDAEWIYNWAPIGTTVIVHQ